MELDRNARMHDRAAHRHELIAICHKVLAGDETANRAAMVVGRFALHHEAAAMTNEDAALAALRWHNGDMAAAHETAASHARDHLRAMGAARLCSEAGLFLADYIDEYEDNYGDSRTRRLLVAFKDRSSVVAYRAAREALGRLLHVGLVSEPTHCQHAHDCCGHWYASRATVRWVDVNLFEVTQHWQQNV